jgi:SAM-dependent methyltransferase
MSQRWTWRSILDRAVAVLRTEGIRPLWFGILGPCRWDFRRWHDRSQPSSRYWDEVLWETRRGRPLDAWRDYMRRVYGRLLHDWLPPLVGGRSLKTDLFEEAVTPHHVLPDLGPGSVGLDLSLAVVQAARARLSSTPGSFQFVVGDARRLPLRAGTIARIFCGSSLDHFTHRADIATSVAELARILAPGGVLVVTFDNPHNPVVWLRNRLPFVWLRRLGLVPYYVGPTYGRVEAHRRLESLGLSVTHVTAVGHAPRAPAIWLSALADYLPRSERRPRAARVFEWFERFGRWPTRYRTGYYLALRAEKPHLPDRSSRPDAP